MAPLDRYINKNQAALFAGKQPYFGHDVESKTIPAPTGGWDAISPLSNMEPQYAVTLDNFIPRPGWCEIRGGYNAWTQGLGAAVETLMTYRPPLVSQEMFAVADNNIFDVSDNGVYTTVVSGLSNSRLQHINFTPANGSSYLYAVNGADTPIIYDGATWGNPSISGATPSTFIHINVHKRRIWFIEANSTRAWYLPTDAIQGTANLFDLGAFFTKGGYLVAMGTWTVDGGNGPDDMAVFISSEGQLVVYKGTDPANANAWALVGVFNQPKPLSRRCFLPYGSDLLLITLEGLLPISKSLPFDPSGTRSVALTNRIQNAMLEAAQQGKDAFGWQCLAFPLQSLLIMNVPVQEQVDQIQFAMNSLTGAWCRITGWNANCFETFNDSLYFGDNEGNVNVAYAGPTDLVSPISGTVKCAFNYFDDPGRNKYMSLLRPMLFADGSLTPAIGVDVDFGDVDLVSSVNILTPSGGIWDSSNSLWDSALWSSGAVTVINWLSVGAIGVALAAKMAVNVAGTMSDVSSIADNVFDTGTFDTMQFDGNGATASGSGVSLLRLNAFQAVMEFGGAI